MASGALTDNEPLRQLADAIAARDEAEIGRLLRAWPALAKAALGGGATRQDAAAHFLAPLGCYAYQGDTALHFAAAAHWPELIARLLEAGADVHARNRRGATPLHHAASGVLRSPEAQTRTIEILLAAGADPNAADGNETTPLHRAVRTRRAVAVRALLAGGADPDLPTTAPRPRVWRLSRPAPAAAAPPKPSGTRRRS